MGKMGCSRAAGPLACTRLQGVSSPCSHHPRKIFLPPPSIFSRLSPSSWCNDSSLNRAGGDDLGLPEQQGHGQTWCLGGPKHVRGRIWAEMVCGCVPWTAQALHHSRLSLAPHTAVCPHAHPLSHVPPCSHAYWCSPKAPSAPQTPAQPGCAWDGVSRVRRWKTQPQGYSKGENHPQHLRRHRWTLPAPAPTPTQPAALSVAPPDGDPPSSTTRGLPLPHPASHFHSPKSHLSLDLTHRRPPLFLQHPNQHHEARPSL